MDINLTNLPAPKYGKKKDLHDVHKKHTNRKLRGCTIRCFDDNYKNFSHRGRQKLNKSRLRKTRSAEGLRKSRGRKVRKDFFQVF